jgi:hypothetical protein
MILASIKNCGILNLNPRAPADWLGDHRVHAEKPLSTSRDCPGA